MLTMLWTFLEDVAIKGLPSQVGIVFELATQMWRKKLLKGNCCEEL